MIQFQKALLACGSAAFEEALKAEIEGLSAEQLPLQQGLSLTSQVAETPHEVMILRITEDESFITVTTGIFYSGMLTGCSCADDPTPLEESSEYCELQFKINKQTAEATVSLLNNR